MHSFFSSFEFFINRVTLGRVCMKLVIVMGVTWIADLLSWFFDVPYYYWIVTDLLNTLQGVFIFIVVGCQPQVKCCLCSIFWFPYVQLKRLSEYMHSIFHRFQVSGAMKRMWSNRSFRLTNTTQGPASSSQGMASAGESTSNNISSHNKIPMETFR